MGKLELQQLTVSYGGDSIVENIDITVQNGELFSLLGPSGAGKTTLLKAIAGLTNPTAGKIVIDGTVVNDFPAEKRDAVLLFQKPLLFPFLNVYDNIGFGLKMIGVKGAAAGDKISKMISMTELDGLEKRKIHQLSGGQQQRVALCRALVLKPSILLLDEPLSNLDYTLRYKMRGLIRSIQQQTGTTMLFVTHDQTEAFSISDRIGILGEKTLLQLGTPREIYSAPRSQKVAEFIGNSNFISRHLLESLASVSAVFSDTDRQQRAKDEIVAVIRPEDIEIVNDENMNSIEGTILNSQFEGAFTRLTVQTAVGTFVILYADKQYRIGDRLHLLFPFEKIQVFPS